MIDNKKVCVLCVDDEPHFLISVKEILENVTSFIIDTANSVNEAIQLLDKKKFMPL